MTHLLVLHYTSKIRVYKRLILLYLYIRLCVACIYVDPYIMMVLCTETNVLSL